MALSSTSTKRYWSPRCRGPWAVVTLYGGGRVYIRPAIVEATKALDAILRTYNYKTYASQTGAFSCRPVAGTSSWSLHAYGVAMDINWLRNLYSYRLVTDMNLNMPADISRIRTNNGRQVWQWGGYWRKKDCLTGDTRVITRSGSKAIADLAGTEVELLSTSGDPLDGKLDPEWVKAPIESYGFDKTYTVNLRRRNGKTSIRCTANHRWPVQLRSGKVELIKTSDLEDVWKDHSKIVAMQYPEVTETWSLDPYHVAMGIIWGDGSDYNNHGSRTPKTSCELCGKKTELAPWLEDYAGYWRDTDHGIKAWKMDIEMNSLPDVDATLSQKISFFIGWFSTDGCMKGRVPTLSTSDESALRWINEEAPNLGLTITSTGFQEAGKSGFNSTKDNFTVVFRHIPKEYLIRSSHIDLWTPNDKTWYGWKLVSVEENEYVEEVFCATVEGRGVFAIDSPTVPILTGNSMHFQICCTPADLATGINWKTVHGHASGSIPEPPVVKPPPEPTFPIHGDDEGDEEDMRLFRDHNGIAWILSGRERHAISANEYKALKQTWMPNHDLSKASPFYNPIVSQVILDNTVKV